MQGFRGALVITGFVMLGLGSNLAWHYPRPVPLGPALTPTQVMARSGELEAAGIRCRPTADWSDLLVESEQLEQARQVLPKPPVVGGDQPKLETPPELLADLGGLPGVKKANVWICDDHEAVVALAMRHGAFAGDAHLLQQVIERVQSARPGLDAANIKILDENGSDLNFIPARESAALALPLQKELQQLADGLVGPKQALVSCHLSRAKDFRIHLQTGLLLTHSANAQPAEELQKQLSKRLQEWVTALNRDFQGKNYWRAEDLIYVNLGERNDQALFSRRALDSDRGVSLDELEVKEWCLRQRPLGPEYVKLACWGLTAPVPTPWQLGLGLAALGPAIFGWCLLMPWLLGRHRLGASGQSN